MNDPSIDEKRQSATATEPDVQRVPNRDGAGNAVGASAINTPRRTTLEDIRSDDRAMGPSGVTSTSASVTLHPTGKPRKSFIVASGLPSIRPFYGIVQDIRARAPYYLSDWTDAWNYRVVPATLLIFFAK
jgi:hypothetical protein